LPFIDRRRLCTKRVATSFDHREQELAALFPNFFALFFVPPLQSKVTLPRLRTEIYEAKSQGNVRLLSILYCVFLPPYSLLQTADFFGLRTVLLSHYGFLFRLFVWESNSSFSYLLFPFFLVFTFTLSILLASVICHFASSISLVYFPSHIFAVVLSPFPPTTFFT